ncbi:DUF1778 domain-containing protein [Pleurocapsales cyanobacterium LEGE 06147]|nr:DUF1778 domain-containing protein [Pleurocapsales cyanobacterium LEGE 06147]
MSTSSDKGSSKASRAKKTARLEARVTQEQKKEIETAAYLRGQTITEFVVSVLAEASLETIKKYEVLELTERDRACFIDALLNSSAPNKKSIADAQWYKQVMNK